MRFDLILKEGETMKTQTAENKVKFYEEYYNGLFALVIIEDKGAYFYEDIKVLDLFSDEEREAIRSEIKADAIRRGIIEQ